MKEKEIKSQTDCKGNSKAVFIRLCDCLCRKANGIFKKKKPTTTNK
jgi:hypothetical protein